MTDIDRVKQMVQDGRITPEEGERLIAVLSEAQAADDELQQVGEALDAEARAALPGEAPERPAEPEPAAPRDLDASRSDARRAPLPPTPPTPPTRPTPATPATPPTRPTPAAAPVPPAPSPDQARARLAPEGTRWVLVEMLAGDLDVRVDGNLDKPAIESDGPAELVLESTRDGYRVRWDQQEGGFLDRMLGRLRTGNLDLRIPAGYGIDLAATAGDVELAGVPYLRGYLTAGDLDASGLKGIDFTCRAGDIDVDLDLTAGAHRLTVTAGDVNVRLAPGSDVTVKADVSIGDADSNVSGVTASRRSLGARLNGTLGSGAATLEIQVTTGDVDVEVGRG